MWVLVRAFAKDQQMLRAIGFKDHPTAEWLLCPPARFSHFEQGTTDFCYNPVSRYLDMAN